MTPEQKKGVQDAMTALAQIPGYSGAAIALFTNDFQLCQVAKHGVRDDLVDKALFTAIERRNVERPSIIVPPGYQNRAQRRQHGSG